MSKSIYVFAFLVMAAAGCTSSRETDYQKTVHDPLLYCKTVKKLNDIVLENNFPPMIAARNYTYANVAAYEVISAGDSSYNSLSGQVKDMPAMPKPPAGAKIDYPLAAMLAFTKVGNAVTFPEGSMMEYYDHLKHIADSSGMSEEMINASAAYADTVSSAVLTWSKKDNYAPTRSATKYTVSNEDGRWIPTPPAYSQALEPHWMEIRTFVLDSASQCKPVAPPPFNMKDTTSRFYRLTIEVKNRVDSLNDEQKHIADFWDDNPFKLNVSGHVMFGTKKFSPAGHWMNIVGIAAEKKQADFNTTVYAYTKTAVAIFDGFISCWEEKFRSNRIRPETVIDKYIDPNWRPYIQTPPFPAYTSGHSVISGAAAEVMTDIFGDNFAYRDTSELEFGINHRNFTSFRQAALEASVSRLYGGIHYRDDLDMGNLQGKAVGTLVVTRLKMKK